MNNKYNRKIIGTINDECGNDVTVAAEVDVYAVLHAWNVTNPMLQHAIKKSLAPGERGHKTFRQDLVDIRDSIDSAIKFHDGLVSIGGYEKPDRAGKIYDVSTMNAGDVYYYLTSLNIINDAHWVSDSFSISLVDRGLAFYDVESAENELEKHKMSQSVRDVMRREHDLALDKSECAPASKLSEEKRDHGRKMRRIREFHEDIELKKSLDLPRV